MNLLDQLTNFCNSSISIYLLQCGLKEHKDTNRMYRPHSVSITNKHQDNRLSKSIGIIQTWTPCNQQQSKQKILYKLSRTLSNKVRKQFYIFWVNCEHAIKNKEISCHKQKTKLGAQKIIGFIQSYQTKITQCFQIQRTFSKIKQFSSLTKVQECLKSAISPSIKRQQQSFFVAYNTRQKQMLKLQLFQHLIKITLINKNIQYFFNQIKNQAILKEKHQYLQNNYTAYIQFSCIQPAKSPQIKIININKSNLYLKQQEYFHLTQKSQTHSRSFNKISIDKVVQNSSETYDNSLLFIQRPQISPQKRYQIESIEQKDTKKLSFYKKNHSKANLQSHALLIQPNSKNQTKFSQRGSLIKKSNYSTPLNRSVSSSQIFNVDQSRLLQLQKKLFGQSKETNKFQVNGQDWKNDRKALEQIICNIRPSLIIRRKSTYQFLNQKTKYLQQYRNTAPLIKTEKENVQIHKLQMKCTKKQDNLNKTTINEKIFNDKIKNQQKILISLKPRKKNSTEMVASLITNDNKQLKRQKRAHPRKIQN